MPAARFRMAANAAIASDKPPGAMSSSGNRSAPNVGGFHPTVLSLFALVIAEYALYIYARHYFRHAHGG